MQHQHQQQCLLFFICQSDLNLSTLSSSSSDPLYCTTNNNGGVNSGIFSIFVVTQHCPFFHLLSSITSIQELLLILALSLSLSQFFRQRRTPKERGVTSGTKCAGSATFRSEGRLKHTTTITKTQPAKLPTISLSSSFASLEPNFSTATTTAVCDIVISSQRPNTTTTTMNLT